MGLIGLCYVWVGAMYGIECAERINNAEDDLAAVRERICEKDGTSPAAAECIQSMGVAGAITGAILLWPAVLAFEMYEKYTTMKGWADTLQGAFASDTADAHERIDTA
jgi:hypothetical protein